MCEERCRWSTSLAVVVVVYLVGRMEMVVVVVGVVGLVVVVVVVPEVVPEVVPDQMVAPESRLHRHRQED